MLPRTVEEDAATEFAAHYFEHGETRCVLRSTSSLCGIPPSAGVNPGKRQLPLGRNVGGPLKWSSARIQTLELGANTPEAW